MYSRTLEFKVEEMPTTKVTNPRSRVKVFTTELVARDEEVEVMLEGNITANSSWRNPTTGN